MTPYHHPATVETPLSSEQPLSTGRRDLLRHLRELADSPLQPPSSETTAVKSPELRWTEQLATTEKEKATALRKVAELQDEIAKMRALGESPYDHTGSSSNNNNNSNKHVGFLSPMANVLLQSPSTTTPSSHHHHHRAASRRVLTPHPKRSLPKATSPSEVDAERKLLMESAERTPFQYDAEGTTFTIRRPHGYAAEVDLWYKAGQLPAKLYANNADVEHPSTIEVAAVVEADDSIFVLFESGHVRHHTSNGLSTEYGNVEERAQPLGTVSYIDRETNEKEYSLDDLYESALYIRGHYCATVRSFAAALQLDRCHHHDNNDNHHHSEPSVPVETADKAVGTDKVLEEPKEAAAAATGTTNQAENAENKSKRSPPPVVAAEESSTDVLVVFLQLLFSTIFRFLWFVLVSLPLRILTATAVTAASVVLLSLLWLYVANDNGAAEMGAVVMRIYSNQHRAGIM